MAVIYALTCSINGFAYIGVTNANLAKRYREHRCLCKSNKHHATRLTDDWNKYGESVFSMVILEETEYSHRGSHCAAEQKWIDHYKMQGKLYNAHASSAGLGGDITKKGVEAARTATGNRWTSEANEKRRLAQLGKPKGHGAKISATKQAKKLMMI
jgi:group I intron endonuclease